MKMYVEGWGRERSKEKWLDEIESDMKLACVNRVLEVGVVLYGGVGYYVWYPCIPHSTKTPTIMKLMLEDYLNY